MATYTFVINGMHCASCTIITKEVIGEIEGVTCCNVSLAKGEVVLEGNFSGKSEDDIIALLDEKIAPHGYRVSRVPLKKAVQWHEFAYALPIAAGVVLLFVLLQKVGVVNLVNTAEVGYGAAFLIGLVASVSSCMAVVGGLVLSMSANFAKSGAKVMPHLLFHVSRLVTFFVLGGLIGAIGASFQFGASTTALLSALVGIVMLLLGINLLDVTGRSLVLTLPTGIAERMRKLQTANRVVMPLLAGFVTFFLPCGFTQSMQLYALSLGDAWKSASILTVFALGTLPVLAMLSFGVATLQKSQASGIFFKTAGLVVIIFALFNIMNSLASVGIIRPLFTL